MRSKAIKFATTMALVAALAISPGTPGQQQQSTSHQHYKLIDLGTFGGPNSSVPIVFNEINGTVGAQGITNQGIVTGTFYKGKSRKNTSPLAGVFLASQPT